MDLSKFSIKQIEEMFAEGSNLEDLVDACRQDGRTACSRLVRRFERLEAEKQRLWGMYQYERDAWEDGLDYVAGVDEAGRGPLAGPVSVAAVILPQTFLLPKINDSKKLSAKVRNELYDEIMAKAVDVRHVFIDEKTIDSINILQATLKGMYDAVFALEPRPDKVLIDAVHLEQLPMPNLSIVKGDAKSASIAAASVIAKVARDRLMDEYDKLYPEYGFASHKGYGTAEHVEAVRRYGPCPIHRLTFEPIKSIALR